MTNTQRQLAKQEAHRIMDIGKRRGYGIGELGYFVKEYEKSLLNEIVEDEDNEIGTPIVNNKQEVREMISMVKETMEAIEEYNI